MPTGLGDEHSWHCASLDTVGYETTTATDLSGNGYTGTLTNMDAATDWVSDTDSGGTVAWDMVIAGSQHIATTTPIPDSGSAATISVCGWVKTGALTNDRGGFSWDDSVSTQRTFWLRADAGTGNMEVFSSPNGLTTAYQRWIGTTGIDDGAWHHWCCTLDCTLTDGGNNNKYILYLDGVVESITWTGVGSPAAGLFDNSNGMLINTRNGNIGTFLNARYDDVRTFARVLTAEEVTHLASARGVLGSPGNRRRRILIAG